MVYPPSNGHLSEKDWFKFRRLQGPSLGECNGVRSSVIHGREKSQGSVSHPQDVVKLRRLRLAGARHHERSTSFADIGNPFDQGFERLRRFSGSVDDAPVGNGRERFFFRAERQKGPRAERSVVSE